MTRYSFVLAFVLYLASSSAQAAGFKFVEIPGDSQLQALKGAVWYPCAQPASDLKLGPYDLAVAKDCPITGEKLPLVVISHGRGGSFLGHHDTAETLADAGFIVIGVNHPGDNAMDKSRMNDFSVFVERPLDIKRVTDYMLSTWPDAEKIDANRIGFFGFSRGGYTGLVVIGANPLVDKRTRLCEGSDSSLCDHVRKGELPELTHDTRIKAAVIADPLSIFFRSESFANVKVPIQLWSSEHGGDGVTPESIVNDANWLPRKAEFHLVPKAQHFSFLAPCPTDLANVAPDICADEPGFDRVAFHKEFNADVLAFFRKHLLNAQQP